MSFRSIWPLTPYINISIDLNIQLFIFLGKKKLNKIYRGSFGRNPDNNPWWLFKRSIFADDADEPIPYYRIFSKKISSKTICLYLLSMIDTNSFSFNIRSMRIRIDWWRMWRCNSNWTNKHKNFEKKKIWMKINETLVVVVRHLHLKKEWSLKQDVDDDSNSLHWNEFEMITMKNE